MRQAAAALLCCVFAAPAGAQEVRQAQCVANIYRDSIVHISGSYRTVTGVEAPLGGAGVIISAEGRVMTAAHVVAPQFSAGEPRIEVRIASGNRLAMRIRAADIAVNRALDLATFMLPKDAPDHGVVPRGASSGLRPNTMLVFAGYPNGPYLETTSGELTNLDPYSDGVALPFYLARAPLDHGMSGGPVIDYDGRLVGIIHGGHETTQGLGYFAPIDEAQTLIGAGAPAPGRGPTGAMDDCLGEGARPQASAQPASPLPSEPWDALVKIAGYVVIGLVVVALYALYLHFRLEQMRQAEAARAVVHFNVTDQTFEQFARTRAAELKETRVITQMVENTVKIDDEKRRAGGESTVTLEAGNLKETLSELELAKKQRKEALAAAEEVRATPEASTPAANVFGDRPAGADGDQE